LKEPTAVRAAPTMTMSFDGIWETPVSGERQLGRD
jgi:hypothetical protein